MNDKQILEMIAKSDPALDTPDIASLRKCIADHDAWKRRRKEMIRWGIVPPTWLLIVAITFGVILVATGFALMFVHGEFKETWPLWLAFIVSMLFIFWMKLRYPYFTDGVVQ